MKAIDTFEFYPRGADSADADHDRWIDVLSTDWGGTAYKPTFSDLHISSFELGDGAEPAIALLLPAVQAVREAAVIPHSDARFPNNDDAMDLIAWALDQIA